MVLLLIVPPYQRLAVELRANPVGFLAADALKAPIRAYFGKAASYRDNADLPGEAQMHSIQLIDDAFVTRTNGSPAPVRERTGAADGKPWNVLLFIMESTGADYVFDTSEGSELPMSFLRRMADEGLYLTNHHAAANSSPSAVFSIFTGLYPRPTREQFAMRSDAAIPTLNRYLGDNYSCFLIHPSSLTYCFPQHLFANNGFTELNNQDALPKGAHTDFTDLARNELAAVDFLLQRLDRAQEPFFGVYWSFIPHHPYSDYGPEFRVRHDLKNRCDLYCNNLRALDAQLRRVYEHLTASGLIEHTVLVFVGDHGEAFGQHPGVWAHAFGSYGEMYRAPVIFWQPRLISPQTVHHPTSHPDIVPTLLDLLGKNWDAARFQGESVLREPARKYIFSMDLQADYLTSIDRQMNKVTLVFQQSQPLIYNLAKDREERLPLSEDRFSEQIQALFKYRNYQTRLISDYQAAIASGKKFPPVVSAPVVESK